MKIHWASKRELRAFYGEEVNCFRKQWGPSGHPSEGTCPEAAVLAWGQHSVTLSWIEPSLLLRCRKI